MARKILALYITISFLFNFSHSFVFAIYTVFLKERGMDLMQINLINAFFMFAIFIFEIPTGSFADRYGRKASIVLGSVFYGGGMLAYYFSDSFWGFVIAELTLAFGATMYSGATEAWAVDSLKFYSYDGCLLEIFKRESQFKQLGIVIGALIGSYVANYDLALPWLMAFAANIAFALFCQATIREDYFKHNRSLAKNASMALIAKDSFHFGVKEKRVFFAILFTSAIFMCFQPLNMYWNIVLTESYGLSVGSLGWMFMGVSAFIVIGSQFSTAFAKKFKNESEALVLSQVVTTAGILVAALMAELPIFVAGFLFHELGRGLFGPLKQSYINHRIPSEKRATILSFDSMINKGAALVGLVVSGYVAKIFSISVSWIGAGLALAAFIPLFLSFKPKE